ncbi:hypothetical protein C8F01DRAFT_39604 [Mycena amicta]|nr:hypothetical protein C8F01DRAFT_39604 [Mycena amicta]
MHAIRPVACFTSFLVTLTVTSRCLFEYYPTSLANAEFQAFAGCAGSLITVLLVSTYAYNLGFPHEAADALAERTESGSWWFAPHQMVTPVPRRWYAAIPFGFTTYTSSILAVSAYRRGEHPLASFIFHGMVGCAIILLVGWLVRRVVVRDGEKGQQTTEKSILL